MDFFQDRPVPVSYNLAKSFMMSNNFFKKVVSVQIQKLNSNAIVFLIPDYVTGGYYSLKI